MLPLIDPHGMPLIREKRDSRTGPVVYLLTNGRPSYAPADYTRIAKEAYQQNVIVYRCIRLIAENASAIPFLLYDGTENEVEDHPLLDLLDRPNPFWSGAQLSEAWYSWLLTSGNAYDEFVASERGSTAPPELWILRSDRMSIELGRRGFPAKYVYKAGQNETTFPVDQTTGACVVHHEALWHPTSDTYGLSPIEAAALSVDAHNDSGKYNIGLLRNMARPPGALIYKGPEGTSLTDDQFMRVTKSLEDKYQGPDNAGRPMVLDGNLEWQPMGYSPVDMEFIETKHLSAREIALGLGVPPMLLGIPGDNTYSNYKEANSAFFRQTILPLVGKRCRMLTNWLAPYFGEGLRVWFNADEVEALAPDRDAKFKRYNDASFLKIDEKREAVGYDDLDPPDPNKPGDVVLAPLGELPLGVEPPAMSELPPVDQTDETGKVADLAAARANKA